MNGELTAAEFAGIRKNLENISDTWADLWILLSLTQARVTQLLRCRYQDIQGASIILPTHRANDGQHLPLSYTARIIIQHRRKRYPDDIFLFQSHSSRVRSLARPVTLIAFNTALKKAAQDITYKRVSSKSALYVIR